MFDSMGQYLRPHPYVSERPRTMGLQAFTELHMALTLGWANQYHDPAFDALRLTIMGVKSTCKDRWRQVLAEADRIPHKHLLTLEAAISSSQTTEMQAKQLQLVLPRTLHATYTTAQQAWLMDVSTLIALVRERQGA